MSRIEVVRLKMGRFAKRFFIAHTFLVKSLDEISRGSMGTLNSWLPLVLVLQVHNLLETVIFVGVVQAVYPLKMGVGQKR